MEEDRRRKVFMRFGGLEGIVMELGIGQSHQKAKKKTLMGDTSTKVSFLVI